MTGRRGPRPAFSAGANRPSTQAAGSHKTPREATCPERQQCLGVHNNETRALYQPFVSATLALRELLSISWSKSAIPAPHPSRLLSPADGPLPRLFPPACPLSAAFISWMLPPCASLLFSLCLLQLPSAKAYITRDTSGRFFPLCFGVTEIGCDVQRPVMCGCKCSLPAMSPHKAPCPTS